MERVEVIFQVASAARAKVLPTPGPHLPAEIVVRQLCAAVGIGLVEVPAADPMLGGSAYARLDIADSDVPENGCLIWYRQGVSPERQAFAIAHELGHFLLHRGEGAPLHLPCNDTDIDDRAAPGTLRTEDHRVEEYTPRARRELEANAFAAELIAPRAEIRQLFAANPHTTPAWLATTFGITEALAYQRLVDTVFTAAILQRQEIPLKEGSSGKAVGEDLSQAQLLAHLDYSQQEAARATTPALVIAGPGTGKTATLIGRVAHLLAERGIQPERILALTFSNRAAGEMRERLIRHHLPGERMPVMTIHAFAASLLREYASQVPCGPGESKLSPDFRILDQSDAFLLMEELLAELPLFYYRSLSNPTAHVRTLLADFSHARDKLLTPEEYLAQVEAMPLMPTPAADAGDAEMEAFPGETMSKNIRPEPPPGTYTREQVARARERALAYGVWDRALRRRGMVDFGGLIQRATELLRTNAQVRAEVRGRYTKVLVDEFQDTNLAAAELLLLAAGDSRQELWVVGDRNQSIYRWRGASPANLTRLAEHFPTLQVFTLRRCYRSVPAIVQLGSTMAARMAEQSPPPTAVMTGDTTAHWSPTVSAVLQQVHRPVPLEAHRQEHPYPPVLQSEFINTTHEHLGLAAAIPKHRALGIDYGDQAILCRTHRQALRIATALAAAGVPVRQMGNFFERQEIKDALALFELAAGPGPQGLLRGERLLIGMGYMPPTRELLASVVRFLATARISLPKALSDPTLLAQIPGLSLEAAQGLLTLGQAAQKLRRASPSGGGGESALSKGLADFLMAPGGYAWHLLLIADGVVAIPASSDDGVSQQAPGRQRAQAALAALGELIQLAARFDLRWKQEPDFRLRLSQAVAHWQQGERAPMLQLARQESQPDTAMSAPGADVQDEDKASLAGPPLTRSLAPLAPPVRCFLHYLSALRAADALIPVPAANDDAVQVLTLHASKGLEFSAVYLPGLAQGSFPPTTHRREEAAPPGFREVEAPGEQEAEERCLLYVGVTRARDVVALTRPTSDARGKRQPSSLLALVEGAVAEEHHASLLSNEELAALAARSITLPDLDDQSGREEPEPGVSEETLTSPLAGASKRTYTLRELEQYLECPRQYKYAYGYGLTDPGQHVVYRFHRCVRRGLGLLRQMQAVLPAPDWATLEHQFKAEWEAEGPVGHAYDTFYWEHARSILRHEWKKLISTQVEQRARTTLIAEPLQVELARCRVKVTADQVTVPSNAPSDAQTIPTAILTRLHTGRPHKADANDFRLPLYYLGHQQQHPNTPALVKLAYLGDTLSEVSPELALQIQGDVIDMTSEARKAAESYTKPGRKKRSRLDKLDEAARGIEEGRFSPRPDAERCKACAYYYICPADPEER